MLSLVLPDQARETRRMMRQVGIDEPFISPDAALLRQMSPAPTRKAAPSPKPTELVADDRSELEPWSEREGGRPNTSSQQHPVRARPQSNKDRRPSFTGRHDSNNRDAASRPVFDPSKRFASAPSKRPFQSGRPNTQSPRREGKPAEAPRDRAMVAARPHSNEDFRARPKSGPKPWESRKPNQVGRSSAPASRSPTPQRKDFSDRPFASGPTNRKRTRSMNTRTKAAK